MDHRFSLRFESGERRGETIPITGSGLSVGRKPGNSLQILDNSVSGQHAELKVDGDGVVLRDLGSTNGTRVGSQRVIETRLKPGDTVLFGNIRLSFLDASSGEDDGGLAIEGLDAPVAAAPIPASAPLAAPRPLVAQVPAASAPAPTAVATDSLQRVSADVLAKSKKRSFAGLVVLVLLVAGGAGAYVFLGRGGGSDATVRAVEAVPGNLLADGFSFEDERDTWTAPDGAPAAFLKSGLARRSGALGLSADVDAGEWALARSASLRPTAGQALTARAFVRVKGDVEARLGLEFAANAIGDAALPANVVAWSDPVASGATFGELTVSAVLPPGYATANVVVLARALAADGGSAHVDDVSALVDASAARSPAPSIADATLHALGARGTTLALTRVDRVLLSNVAVVPSAAGDEVVGAALSATSDGSAFAVRAEGPGDELRLVAETALARARIATIGKGGYKTHATAFERADVDALLLGSGIDVVRLRFTEPVTIVGTAAGAASRIAVRGPAARSFALQVDFAEERKSAGNLAYEARAAEKKGDLGGALAKWGELLNAYPFEEALVSEAETTRAKLIQAGLEELRIVSAEVERARFFQLAELSRQCRDKALAVGARYAKSEVEAEAARVADSVAQDLAAFGTERKTAERARLEAILAALEAKKQDGLAGEVRAYLDAKLRQ